MGVIGIELEQAISMMVDYVKQILETEMVELSECSERILAESIIAAIDNPPFPRSPLDGYAFFAESVKHASAESPVTMPVKHKIYAGDYFGGTVLPGEAVRIMTGAPIPCGCDCVVRQEDVTSSADNVSISSPMKAFQNYCFQGEDFKKGEVLVEAGTRLSFIEMGIIASTGIHQVKVYRKPRILLLATGDEVLLPGKELAPGKIYGSNLHMLYGRLKELGMEVTLAKQLEDNPEAVAGLISQEASDVDFIITTGGVSVGDKDIFHQVLPLLGCERLFWRVNLKPGTPAMFSMYQDTPMLNLSGNPFAALTTFELLARPVLAKLSQDKSLDLKKKQAQLAEGFDKSSQGRRFLRGRLEHNVVKLPETKKHASGMLASMSGCNCFIDIKAGTGALQPGDSVLVWEI